MSETDPPGDGDTADPGIPVIVEPPDAPAVEASREEELEVALATAEKEKKDNWDKYLRAVADLENSKKRHKRDVDDAKSDMKMRVLKEMLPVVDNLERAIEHADQAGSSSDPHAILEGVRLVLRQFTTAFERLEVTPIDAMGQPFDPMLHEAISQQESADHPPGTVISVLQRGYRHGERLLRPAMVVVARAPASTPGAAPAEA
jgi:molecular chaperone GrpE